MLKRIFLISILVVAANSYAIWPVIGGDYGGAQGQAIVNCTSAIIKASQKSESEAESICKSLESNNKAYKQCFDSKYSELFKVKITALEQSDAFKRCQS